MSKRYCLNCGKLIKIPHLRLWEENTEISYMMCFCNYNCLVQWAVYVEYYHDYIVNKRFDKQKGSL